MGNYRSAFLVTLIVAILLAAGLGFVGWRSYGRRSKAAESQPMSAPSSASGVGNGQEQSAPAAPVETPLAPVQLSPQRLQSIGVKTGIVEIKPVYNEIRTVGNVDVDEQLLSSIQLRFAGWIQKVFANYTYQYVHKGQPLFTIYSPDLVTTEQEYLIAKQNKNLLATSTVPGVASGAVSLLNAAVERLKQWQIPAREIARLETTNQVRNELEIDSPVSGFITERNALPHMYAQPETRLYSMADLSTVWVYANVFQNEIGQIRLGDPAAVTVDSYPGRNFDGRVDYIWPQVDMDTRTVKVRLAFPNPGLKLTPGMFVNVKLTIPLGRHMVIPTSGVFQTGTQNIVFVDHGGGYLEPRNVELGPQAGDEFIVLKGLRAGERIVTSANFLIDSESQIQAALGSFMPPPPGAGAAAAMNAPAAKATIEFTTNPSPPHKGSNALRVKLTGSNGEPVAGAQVTVTFFMPAMPAMGMSAMRTVATLNDEGGGFYEGTGNLASGGTWQVTITAQKGGQTIAAKQLTVSAGGGM
ncbi:MAG TPA: FixH family protein [Terriglobia bacterium]|nr:FixH family protein [Terriglobia bacterium]